MTNHKILINDSKDLSKIKDKSIHLIVTSPPYPMIEMWDEIFGEDSAVIKESLLDGDGFTAFREMHNQLKKVWAECDRVLIDGGFICINIGDATRTINKKFQLYPNHVKVVNYFYQKGYSVLPDIHWRKETNSPNKFMGSGMYPAGAYVTYEHEYILIFRKGGKREFTEEENLRRKESAYFWEERNIWFSDLWDVKGTSQIVKESGSRDRNASFPFEIPYRLVNMYSIKGDIVLDPFMGFGTTNLACMASNRNSIGIEIDSVIAEKALERLRNSKEYINQVIQNRIFQHNKFISSISEEKQKNCYYNKFYDFLVKTRQEINIKFEKIDKIIQQNNIIKSSYEEE